MLERVERVCRGAEVGGWGPASHICILKPPSDATPLRRAHANHQQLTPPATSVTPRLITAHDRLHLSSPPASPCHLSACHVQSSR